MLTADFFSATPQDLSESMGLSSLNSRLQDPAAVDWVSGVFPKVLAPCHS